MESTFIVNQRIGDSGGVLYTNRWTLDVAVAVAPPDAVPSPWSCLPSRAAAAAATPNEALYSPFPP